MKSKSLSVVIVSYNTKDVLKDCLVSLKKVSKEIDFDTLVSDNGSTDGTVEMLKSKYKWVKLVENKKNLGFAAGNNKARDIIESEFVLFLNSDTVVHKNTLKTCVKYLKENRDVGAMTCKVLLKNGKLDKDTRRSFPTPLVALSHFSGLDKIFPNSTIFSKYWYGYINEDDKIRDVDVVQGAFNMMPRKVLDEVGWFDEDYFLDGEDIDLCWKVKKLGYKVMYVPTSSITHIKKASKKGKPSLKAVTAGVSSMEIFYKKRMWSVYPIYLNILVLVGIRLLKYLRIIKYYLRP